VNFYFALTWTVPVVVTLLAGVPDPPLHPAIITNESDRPIIAIISLLMINSLSASVVRRLLIDIATLMAHKCYFGIIRNNFREDRSTQKQNQPVIFGCYQLVHYPCLF